MQWDPGTRGWEPWLPFISPLAGRLWPWFGSIPGPAKSRAGLSEARHSPAGVGMAEGPSVAMPPALGQGCRREGGSL